MNKRNVLSTIILIFMIFQMVTIATAIDIGAEAINRTAFVMAGKTHVNETNPANVSGVITSIEIWCDTDFSDVEVAIFYLTGTSGDYHEYSTRDHEYIGSVTAGAKRTFAVDLDVVAGDFIGYYTSTGNSEFTSSGGGGSWMLTGDYIPCTEVMFNLVSSAWQISLYGTGVQPTYNFFGHN